MKEVLFLVCLRQSRTKEKSILFLFQFISLWKKSNAGFKLTECFWVTCYCQGFWLPPSASWSLVTPAQQPLFFFLCCLRLQWEYTFDDTLVPATLLSSSINHFSAFVYLSIISGPTSFSSQGVSLPELRWFQARCLSRIEGQPWPINTPESSRVSGGTVLISCHWPLIYGTPGNSRNLNKDASSARNAKQICVHPVTHSQVMFNKTK